MANTDFSVLLKAVLDKSGINTELKQVQEIVKKYSIDIMPELKTASLRNQMKAVSKDIANDFNKTFGTNLTGNDVFKAFENQAKAVEKATKQAADAQRKVDQERLANIEKIRKASAQAQSQKEVEKQNQVKSILDKQISAYREIQNINKQIAGLDPTKDSNQIAALQEKKKIQQEIFLSSQKQLGVYKTQETNEVRLKAFAEERKRVESEIAVIKGKQADTNVKNNSNASLKESQQVYNDLLKTARQLNSLQTKQLKITPESNPEQWKTLSTQIDEVSSKYDKLWSEFWSKPQNLELFKMEDLNRLKELGYTVDETKSKLKDMLSGQAGKIQLGIETGDYSSKVQSLIGQTQKWTDANGNARISTTNLQSALNNLNTAYANITATGGNTEANQRALIEAEKQLGIQIQDVTNKVTTMNAQFATDQSVQSLLQKYQQFYDKNSAAHRRWGAQIKAGITELSSGMPVTIQRANQLEMELNQVGNAARQAGKLGKSWFDTMKSGMKSFSYWTSSTYIVMKTVQEVRQAVTTVRELDTALIDLKKTTSMTESQLEQFYYTANDTAKQMGVTTKEIIDQVAAWSRLGYSSAEAATKMAKYSSMFASISPGMDVDKATDGLVSIMKAFDIGNDNPDEVLDGIMSKINIIGNTAATSNDEIVTMLSKSSSAMREANNTLEETIALETAAVEITRDDDSVGTAFKTVAMRIRGYDEETESYTADLENLSGTIADLTKTASTPGGISLFTDASKTEYKSTYQLLKEISEVYDELDDKTQAELLEALAGKRQGQIIAATINNFEAAEKAMDSMADSAGSAEREMAIIMDSVDYKANKLKETGTGIAQNLFERDDMKNVIDTLTWFGERLDWITDKLGLFGSIGLGAGLFTGFKNIGICV